MNGVLFCFLKLKSNITQVKAALKIIHHQMFETNRNDNRKKYLTKWPLNGYINYIVFCFL